MIIFLARTMMILNYRMRNKWWKCQISNKNLLICKKVFTPAWGGFWFVPKRVNANNGKWKCIVRINSSKRIKKSCDFALWDGITWLAVDWSSSTAFEMLVCPSEMPEQICHQKNIYNSLTRVPKQQHSPPKAMKALIVFLLALKCNTFFIYEKYYIQ